MQYVAMGTRCLIGMIFLLAIIGKLAGRNPLGTFMISIRDMGVVPSGLIRPTALAVLICECAVFALLVAPVTSAIMAGLALAAALLLIFAAAVMLAIRRGVRAPCRCFGSATTPLGTVHAVRNILLAAAAALGAMAAPRAGSADAGPMILTAVTGLLGGGLISVLDDVVALFRPIPDSASILPAGRKRDA
ncbi:MauE/DoxX family redox-associated membrane protein [Streptomyces chrestomyceticus]|uniref:MauE/DoxX family redox-associated membrane protein n=1 Tax=Streptomyces chrestomyceticus TaxID=68185 RepID=UPI0035A8BD20